MRLTALIVFVLVFSGCVSDIEKSQVTEEQATTTTLANAEEKHEPSITLFETDKKAYHSREKMNVTIELDSADYAQDAVLKVYGIYSGRNRLDITRKIKLDKGVNRVTYEYTTPSCFGCAGINPGTYNITSELYVGDRLLDSATTTVEMTA